MTGTSPAPRRRPLESWAGLAGVAYVVLFVTGSILAMSGQPKSDSPPAKLISYYSDSGHRDKIGFGWLIAIVGVFFFVWFLGGVRQFMRRADGDGLLTTVATVGGAVYAALTLAALSVDTAITTSSDDTFAHQVYPQLIPAARDAGFVLHSAGGAGVGALMIAASLVALRSMRIPSWAGVVGIASGMLAVFSIFFIPQFLVALWILVTGFLLFRAADTPAPAL